jgi:hypothetical protein
MATRAKKLQEVTVSLEDKELQAKDVLLLLESHEKECSSRYERIEEKLTDQKAFLEKLDLRMWGLAALIVATAIAERFM